MQNFDGDLLNVQLCAGDCRCLWHSCDVNVTTWYGYDVPQSQTAQTEYADAVKSNKRQ